MRLQKNTERGSTLLEMMVVTLIIAIMSCISIPLIQDSLATRQLEWIARSFIEHAHFARQQAFYLSESVQMTPRIENDWNSGWVIESSGSKKAWFMQGSIDPVYFKGGGKQFSGPNTSQKGIIFNAAGAAKTAQGGFVANRLILSHRRRSNIERHLILGSGGRWRICNPQVDSKACR
ncbi:prepilin-type N-terminal cleavage/methylation domain-containing protein [Polynucleobacter paneuropaeus]|nr:prepilin-type N-terminal cleavage/methylation domain-containing protein [Polynucleobacter paneuropaeus]